MSNHPSPQALRQRVWQLVEPVCTHAGYELVDVRFSFAVHKEHGADIAKGIGKAFIAEVARQLEQDKPIWENKVYLERPLLCEGDGPIGAFRRWCKTFYPDWYAEEAQKAYAAAHPG